MRNIEVKVRFEDFERAREVVRRRGGAHRVTEDQEDVYFRAAQGRLKLRKRPPGAELISYRRSDRAEFRASDYTIVPVPDPELLESALADVLGILTVVKKRREVHLLEATRVHLDEVEGLGRFLEFEIVLADRAEEPAARDLAQVLHREFGLEHSAYQSRSYSDLLLDSPLQPP